MNIAFVVPPNADGQPGGVAPRLGLLAVAASTIKHQEHAVHFVDCPRAGIDNLGLARVLLAEGIEVVALSAVSQTLLANLGVAALAKRTIPFVRVIIGGVHPTLYPRETVGLPNLDYVVSGEGEEALSELLAAIATGQPAPRHIPGVSWRVGSEQFVAPNRAVLSSLDKLPLIAEHFPAGATITKPDGRRIGTLQTSRGCPFACSFCSIARTGYRYRPIECVVGEISAFVAQGVRDFFIVDETFTVSRQRTLDLCNAVSNELPGITFRINARVDLVDDEVLAALARAGCRKLYFGVESGSQKQLDALNKGVTLEKIRVAFGAAKWAGISRHSYLMIGLPDETRDEIMETFRFAATLEPDSWEISICRPYPETQLYSSLRASGRIAKDVWREWASVPQSTIPTDMWQRAMSPEELCELRELGNGLLSAAQARRSDS